MAAASTNSHLPSSPAARAFFAALDEGREQVGKDKSKSKQSSSFIQKRIQTLGWRNRYSQQEHYPVQIGSDNNCATTFTVLQVQRGELEGTYGTGATVWPASVVLIKYLERHAAALIRGKRVVDLGAGTGVTSIAAAVLGASHCICTDGEATVVQLARDNIQRAAKELTEQGVTVTSDETGIASDEVVPTTTTIRDCPISVEKYWWGTGRIESSTEQPCDVILVSDCVLPKLYPIAPLVEALDQLLVLTDARAILSYEHRYFAEYDPRDKFRELCGAKHLDVRLVPMEEQDPVYSVEDIEIWQVQRRQPQAVDY